MINLKIQYDKAKMTAVELMSKGHIKEYVKHLKYMEGLRIQMLALKN